MGTRFLSLAVVGLTLLGMLYPTDAGTSQNWKGFSAEFNKSSGDVNQGITAQESLSYYLPWIERSPVGIRGKVALNTNPVGGIALTLRFFDGVDYVALASTTTTPDGSYQFTDLEPLSLGQFYWVSFRNETDPNQVSIWCSNEVRVYHASDWVTVPTFDIANIFLLQPEPGAAVTLPVTFQWLRTVYPIDEYILYIYDVSSRENVFSSNIPTVHDSYTLESLPPSMAYGNLYCWLVEVSNNGYGRSYACSQVTFKSGLLQQAQTMPDLQSSPNELMPPWCEP